ncbi:inner-membrane translocator [Gluconacetobacter diazotrophicus PA1 5]|uniref:ABC transporter permease n=2 Tax=Gluconacetobacter diazotrophicus TaxID=33996 RepID=A0A7W4I8B2_GLUDI|nr:ABC transporter permease [Gluconacetobacter diazotrophicus]ACI50693.1 inner-membrane translocator [Gluconacetobacter diazotrophicus PA1 5]MBB2158148.1 ABC transporter permease [Gluconacetobacter diazotrophicus]TWA99897.1 nucleoside ABC transporter membrane protein [Gluconacetobacter diazotrophicus]CAP56636.1 putative amino acid transporter [Gluconacetobacter diazotrophicus PA1 5]
MSLTFLHDALAATTPILLAALGGAINRQGGTVNVGLDSFILAGALAGEVASAVTGSSLGGVAGAAIAGGGTAALMAAVIRFARTDQIVTGLGFDMSAQAVCRLVVKLAFGVTGLLSLPAARRLPVVAIPELGTLDALTLLSWSLVPACAWFLRHHRLGLRLRAAGESPGAATALGFDPKRLQAAATIAAGVLAGLAGADLSLGIVGAFSTNISNGRGFMALAAFYIGRARPFSTAAACLMLGLLTEAAIHAQADGLPTALAQAAPYLAVICVLGAQAVANRHQPNLQRMLKGLKT